MKGEEIEKLKRESHCGKSDGKGINTSILLELGIKNVKKHFHMNIKRVSIYL